MNHFLVAALVVTVVAGANAPASAKRGAPAVAGPRTIFAALARRSGRPSRPCAAEEIATGGAALGARYRTDQGRTSGSTA
jgi:hypothetical protein